MNPHRRRFLVARRGPAAAYGAILAVAVLQALLLPVPWRSLAGAVPYVIALAVFLAVAHLGPRSAADRGVSWIRAMAVAGGALSVWLVLAFLRALPDGLGAPSGYYLVKVAVTSPVGNHNTAAGLLLVGVVAAAVMVAADRRWTPALVLVSAGVVVTMSRGGALVLVLLAVSARWWASTRRVAGRCAVAAAGVVMTMLGLLLVLDTAPPAGAPEAAGVVGASVVARGELALRGVEVALERPLLGVGLGGFADRAGDIPPPHDHAHQLVAHAAAEGGVVVAVAVILLTLALLVRAWRLPASPLRDVVLLGGIGLVAHAQFEELGGLGGYETVVALLLGLATAAGSPRAAGSPPRARP